MFGIGRTVKNFIQLAKLMKKCGGWGDFFKLNEILMEKQNLAYTMRSKIPAAADGSPVPWYTFPAIEYFQALDVRGLDIFEYGCGASSLFWTGKGANVCSVEHDSDWHDRMKAQSACPGNLLLRTDSESYAKAIHEQGMSYDFIIIDGVWRAECATEALKRLKPESMIILDNSDRETQYDVAEIFRRNGFFQIDFSGFGPCNPYCWTTSLMAPMQSPFTSRWSQPVPIGHEKE